MVMTERDRILLKKISKYQNDLINAIKEFRITTAADLSTIHVLMRRGMVQTVGDIFELTVPMSEETLNKLPLHRDIIKQFRNTASHRYGEIDNMMAFMCITHCANKELVNAINNLLK